jgi:uncharacterized repeat protein (TIGR02543 family)
MKLPTFLRGLAASAGLLGLTSLVLPANAETIYLDDFNDQQNLNAGGSYTQTLAGSVPTVRSGTRGGSASATWSANAEVNGWGQRDYADNNVATPTSSNYLAFTPQAGNIYTLEADITVNGNFNGNWFAIGFVQNPTNWVVSGAFTTVDYDSLTEQGIVRWQAPNVGVTRHVKYTLDTTAPGWTNTQNIGYVGWFTAGPGGINLNSANQVSIDNFKLTAGVANPTVTYDGNGSDGGAVPVDGSSPYTYNATVTTSGIGTMTRSGFNFQSWNTAADGSGTNFNPGDTFTIQDNTTLYARWLPVGSFTVTYNGNGNTGGSVPVDASSPYSGGSSVTVLGNTGSLSRTSFTFGGWNTAANGSGTDYNPADTFTITADTTLYARWTPGPDYVWNNVAATDSWNTTDANWSGATWSNSASNNAFFTTVVGSVSLDTGIVAGAVNVGNTGINFANASLIDGSLSASSLTVQGLSFNSGTYLTNPTLSVDSAVSISGDAAVGRANLNILGGSFTADRIISAPASADWGRLVVSGGTVTATNGVDGSANTTATFAIDLNGGELLTPSVRVADREVGNNNNAWLTFNGGTLKAIGADNADFITTYGGGSNTFVAPGGAIIDTNGRNIGIFANLLNSGGGLTKEGAGTLTLGGLNTYAGDTTVNTGTLVLADSAQLRFVLNETPASNQVTGVGTATFNGDFVIDTSAVTGNSGFIWTLVDRASLTGESFDPVTFSVIGFTDADDDGVWIMSDAKGDWSFDEASGELTLDVGNDYDDWGAIYGLATGSEAGDLDNDGLTNQDEYAFGLIPDSGASVNPISVPLDKATGTFRYTRRATPASSGLAYTVWTSENLAGWTEDTGATASQTVISTAGGVETVEVTLTGTLPLAQPKLFIQVRAN